MRRPAVPAAAAFGTGIWTACRVEAGPVFWLILCTGALAFFIYSKLYMKVEKEASRVLILICIFLAGALLLSADENNVDPLIQQDGGSVKIRGLVTSVKQGEEGMKITLKTDDFPVLVRYYGDNVTEDLTGCYVEAYGQVSVPQEGRNPGCFDYRLYLKSCGIQTILTADRIEVIEWEPVPYLRITSSLRNAFEDRLRRSMDSENAGLVMAMMFGDKTGLDEDMYEDFQKNGTAHILAVSGLHIGILYGFFSMLWGEKKTGTFYFVTMVILLFYMALADFAPSVVRAASMIIIHSFAGILRRRYDLLSAAACVFMAMLVLEPFQLFHTGFQMSFLAVATLGVILPRAAGRYDGIFLVPVTIQVGLAPYTAYVFNYFSAGALIANVPVVFLAGILMPMGLCMLFSMALPEGIFTLLAEIMEAGCGALNRINSLFYMEGASSFDVVSPPEWALILYYGSLFFFLSETGRILIKRKKKKKLLAAAGVIFCAAFAVNCMTLTGFEKAPITFVDVGQGDCVHIRTEWGDFLIDGGGSATYDTGLKTLKPYLLKNGAARINTGFVTHLHEDHYGGIRALASAEMIEKTAMYEANKVSEKQLKKDNPSQYIYLHAGQQVQLGEDVWIEVLWPRQKTVDQYAEMMEDQEDENASCLIMKINYKGVTVLMTGDISSEGEMELVQQLGDQLQCDILKVAHHGSRFSTCEEFIEAAGCSMAVIQVGKNNYGHPHGDVLGRLEAAGVEIFRNDTDGAIGIRPDRKGGFKVVKMIN